APAGNVRAEPSGRVIVISAIRAGSYPGAGTPPGPDRRAGSGHRLAEAADGVDVLGTGEPGPHRVDGQVGRAEPPPRLGRRPPGGFVALGVLHPGVDTDGGRVAAGALGHLAEAGDARRVALARPAHREPAVAQPPDAVDGGVGEPSDPDRDGAL